MTSGDLVRLSFAPTPIHYGDYGGFYPVFEGCFLFRDFDVSPSSPSFDLGTTDVFLLVLVEG